MNQKREESILKVGKKIIFDEYQYYEPKISKNIDVYILINEDKEKKKEKKLGNVYIKMQEDKKKEPNKYKTSLTGIFYNNYCMFPTRIHLCIEQAKNIVSKDKKVFLVKYLINVDDCIYTYTKKIIEGDSIWFFMEHY